MKLAVRYDSRGGNTKKIAEEADRKAAADFAKSILSQGET